MLAACIRPKVLGLSQGLEREHALPTHNPSPPILLCFAKGHETFRERPRDEICMLQAEELVGLATDTTVYLSRWGDAPKVKNRHSTSALPIAHGTLGSQGDHEIFRGRPRDSFRMSRPVCRSVKYGIVPKLTKFYEMGTQD